MDNNITIDEIVDVSLKSFINILKEKDLYIKCKRNLGYRLCLKYINASSFGLEICDRNNRFRNVGTIDEMKEILKKYIPQDKIDLNDDTSIQKAIMDCVNILIHELIEHELQFQEVNDFGEAVFNLACTTILGEDFVDKMVDNENFCKSIEKSIPIELDKNILDFIKNYKNDDIRLPLYDYDSLMIPITTFYNDSGLF